MSRTGHSESKLEERASYFPESIVSIAERTAIPFVSAYIAAVGGMIIGAATVASRPVAYTEAIEAAWYFNTATGGLLVLASLVTIVIWAFRTK